MQLKNKIKKLIKPKKNVHIEAQHVAACVLKQALQNQNLFSEESIVTDKLVLDAALTVSLTTYSSRVHDVYLTIESLGRQSLKPNNIILWLDESEFTLEELPASLKRLSKRGLKIEFCDNYKSYKKLLPSLLLFPSDHIITVDDDVMYPMDFIERLAFEAYKSPNTVICNHAHQIVAGRKGLLPYRNWVHGTNELNAQDSILPVGVGGVLYPKNTFQGQPMEYSKIRELAPSTDDLWFKIMAYRNAVKARKIRSNTDFESNFLQIPGSQVISLFEENLGSNQNDNQLKNILREFDCLNGFLKVIKK
ncbi:hypothetical protein [Shewanella chilikensis]|uniref:hypothetical protein n=1 Tax=Shewanella chilikensis TaxID=558541 RepID=UPI001F2C4FE3|nr:hypothetical protein [Shewanella chilikensis]MCE9789964.1 hypothetical protein [Shewanella chilikensis]